jgi:hypothetical protein
MNALVWTAAAGYVRPVAAPILFAVDEDDRLPRSRL